MLMSLEGKGDNCTSKYKMSAIAWHSQYLPTSTLCSYLASHFHLHPRPCVCGWCSVIVVFETPHNLALRFALWGEVGKSWVLVLGLGWLLPAPHPTHTLRAASLEEFSVAFSTLTLRHRYERM